DVACRQRLQKSEVASNSLNESATDDSVCVARRFLKRNSAGHRRILTLPGSRAYRVGTFHAPRSPVDLARDAVLRGHAVLAAGAADHPAPHGIREQRIALTRAGRRVRRSIQRGPSSGRPNGPLPLARPPFPFRVVNSHVMSPTTRMTRIQPATSRLTSSQPIKLSAARSHRTAT